MTRDKDALSEKDLFEKTSHMIEHASNAKISLQYKRGENWCRFGGYESNGNVKIFSINIANPPNKCINQYTALLHELAHILYASPFTPIRKLVSTWGDYTQYYFDIFNVLEDQRIESHMTRNYLAYKKRFENTKMGLGRQMKLNDETVNDPFNILLSIRFMRDDLVIHAKHYTVYKQALKNVAGTDRFGALRVLISIKKFIDEYKTRIPEQDFQDGECKTGIAEPNFQDDECKTGIPEQDFKQKSDEKKSTATKLSTPTIDNIDLSTSDHSVIPVELTKNTYTDNEIDVLLQEGKSQGERQFQEIQTKLSAECVFDIVPKNVIKIRRENQEYTIDHKVVKDLKRVFKLLKMRQKPVISYSGDSIDVEEYVKNTIKGTNLNKIFVEDVKDSGISIVLSIDASASMRNERIENAREITATLFKSIKEISKVELRGNIWSGNFQGGIGVTEINSINDVGKITVERNFTTTPTHMGLEYTRKMLKQMRGQNKLVIMITDGSPNYFLDNKRVVNTVYDKRCKKSLQKLLAVTPNIICIAMINQSQDIRLRNPLTEQHSQHW